MTLSPQAIDFLWKAFSPQSQNAVPIAALPIVAEIQQWLHDEAAKIQSKGGPTG